MLLYKIYVNHRSLDLVPIPNLPLTKKTSQPLAAMAPTSRQLYPWLEKIQGLGL